MRQAVAFRIYPEPLTSRLYFRVTVFPTLRDLRTYGRDAFHSPSGRRALGWCGTYTVRAYLRRERQQTRPICGEILLGARHLRVGIISHECTHAAFGYARRRRFRANDPCHGRVSVSDGEERFCRVQGELVRQLVAKLFTLGLLIESVQSDGRR